MSKTEETTSENTDIGVVAKNDKVIIQPVEEHKDKLPFHVPGRSAFEKGYAVYGTVLASGEGKELENGTFVPNTIKSGDKVVFDVGKTVRKTYNMSFQGENLFVLSESDIDAIVE